MKVYSSVPSQRSHCTVSAMNSKTSDRKFQKMAPTTSTSRSRSLPSLRPMSETASAPAIE